MFFLREFMVKYILQQGYTPTCAFMMYSYYLLDSVERDSLIKANRELIRRSDELWVFGRISDGVAEEIKLAKECDMPIRYFDYDDCNFKRCEFVEIDESNVSGGEN